MIGNLIVAFLALVAILLTDEVGRHTGDNAKWLALRQKYKCFSASEPE